MFNITLKISYHDSIIEYIIQESKIYDKKTIEDSIHNNINE